MKNIRTSLKRKRARPLSRYDQLPAALRQWMRGAALPWSIQSVERLWLKRLKNNGGDEAEALQWLSRMEANKLALDAQKIWGSAYPSNHNCAPTMQRNRHQSEA